MLKGVKLKGKSKFGKGGEMDLKAYQLSKFISADLLESEWKEYFAALFGLKISFDEFVVECCNLKMLHQLQHKLVVLTCTGTYDDALNK